MALLQEIDLTVTAEKACAEEDAKIDPLVAAMNHTLSLSPNRKSQRNWEK